MRNYEVMVVGETKRLIKKRDNAQDPPLIVVPYEDLFDTLYRSHKAIGHKGRDHMRAYVKKQYANLTIRAITSEWF